jgi:hypothetical protein
MFGARMIKELRRLRREATPVDSEDISFFAGPNGFEARIRNKPRTSFVQQAGADSGASSVCKVTGAPIAGIYPVDVYDKWNGTKLGSGHAISMRLHVSEAVATGDWIVCPPGLVDYLPGE